MFNEAGWPVSVTVDVYAQIVDLVNRAEIVVAIAQYAIFATGKMKDNDGIITKKYDDGKVYEGQMKDGKKHGKGKMTYNVVIYMLVNGKMVREMEKVKRHMLVVSICW